MVMEGLQKKALILGSGVDSLFPSLLQNLYNLIYVVATFVLST